MTKAIQTILGIVIAAAGLWFFFKGVDFVRLGNDLMNSNPVVLIACVALTLVSLWLRALRWRIMLPKVPGASKKNLFDNVMIGFMANDILPARIGEAVRVLILWKKNKYSVATAVGSLVLERCLDTLAFMSMFFIPVFLLDRLSGFMNFALILLMIFCLSVLFLVLYAFFPRVITRFLTFLTGLLPGNIGGKASRLVSQVISNLDWTFSPLKSTVVLVLSCICASCWSLMLYLLAGDSKTFGILPSLFAQAYAAFGAAIPLAPGCVGTLHAFLRQGLVTLGMDKEKAVAITILYHALAYVPVVVIGLWYYFRTHIEFKEVSKVKNQL